MAQLLLLMLLAATAVELPGPAKMCRVGIPPGRCLDAIDRLPRPLAWHDQEYRGTVLQLMGRTDESVAALQEAIALRPDRASAHAALGLSLGESGLLPRSDDNSHRPWDGPLVLRRATWIPRNPTCFPLTPRPRSRRGAEGPRLVACV